MALPRCLAYEVTTRCFGSGRFHESHLAVKGSKKACFAQGDFLEGIRALIVDKDNAPRWNPSSLGQVSDDAVAAFFAPRWPPAEHPLSHL